MFRVSKRNDHGIKALLSSPNEALWRHCARAPDRRVGFLHWLGQGGDLADLIIFTIIRDSILRPGLQDHFERLVKPSLALRFIDIEQFIFRLQHPAAYAEVEPAITQYIEHGILFSGTDRIAQRQ